MVLHRIQGKLKDGKLEIEIPDDLREGEYSVLVEVNQPVDTDSKTVESLLSSGLVGAGSDWDIGDSEQWVQEKRRKRREAREQRWTNS